MQPRKEKRRKLSENIPEVGELVIGTVTRVFPHGAFVSLDEYPGSEGMIHISELSSKWIKNIRDYVEEGQKVVVKVLKIDKEKGHIDLSLKSVKAAQKKAKLDQYKKEKHALKLIEYVANKINDTKDLELVVKELENKFGSLWEPLEKSVRENENIFLDINIPEKWKKALAETAKEKIEPPEVTIKATLELESKANNGVEVIKNSLLENIKKVKEKDTNIEVKYLGAPKYRIKINAPNYKIAENILERFSSQVIKDVTSSEGTGKLVR